MGMCWHIITVAITFPLAEPAATSGDWQGRQDDRFQISCWKNVWTTTVVSDFCPNGFIPNLWQEKRRVFHSVILYKQKLVFALVSVFNEMCVYGWFVCMLDQRAWCGSVSTRLLKCHLLHLRWKGILIQRKLHCPTWNEKEECDVYFTYKIFFNLNHLNITYKTMWKLCFKTTIYKICHF